MFGVIANVGLSTLILALFCVQDAGSQELPDTTCQNPMASYFIMQVDIQPTTFDFDCDDRGVERVLGVIEHVFDRKFAKYYKQNTGSCGSCR